LVLPPKLAPFKVVIVPIYRNKEQFNQVSEKANEIIEKLEAENISVKFDNRDTHKPGWKFAEYEMKGVPLRIGIGPKDLEKNTVELARRDKLTKSFVNQNTLIDTIKTTLVDIQENLYQNASDFMQNNTHQVSNYNEFKETINNKGGFVDCYWDGSVETEEKIKKELKATIRCILSVENIEGKTCVFSGNDAAARVLYAKAY